MMKKPDSVVRIPGSRDSFFRKWFEFLKPFHQLTEREMDIAAEFVRQRYYLGKVITDPEILDTVLMNEDTRRKIREECNITLPHFQVIMGKLRKSRIIVDGKINQKFIPNIDDSEGNFKLLMFFDFVERNDSD